MIENKKNGSVLFIIIFYFFLLRDWLEFSGIPLAQYVDEFIALMAVPIYIYNNYFESSIPNNAISKKKERYSIWVFLYALCGLCGNLLYEYQPFIRAVLPDLLLCVKFWLALYVGKYLFGSFKIETHAKMVFNNIKCITWLYTLLIILDPIFDLYRPIIELGMRSTHLFYTFPIAFYTVCVFMVTILISIQDKVPASRVYIFWICILMCTTFKSKALAAVFAILIIFYLSIIRNKPIRIKTVLWIIPVLIWIGLYKIRYFFKYMRDESARGQLLDTSFLIARDHFPIGSGFGTYASHYSGVIYSPIYQMYDISDVFGLSEENFGDVSDSFWPCILGQTGWLGMIMYTIALWFLWKKIRVLRAYNVSYYTAGLVILIYELIVSSGEPAFFNPLSIPLALLLGYMISRQEKDSRYKQLYYGK